MGVKHCPVGRGASVGRGVCVRQGTNFCIHFNECVRNAHNPERNKSMAERFKPTSHSKIEIDHKADAGRMTVSGFQPQTAMSLRPLLGEAFNADVSLMISADGRSTIHLESWPVNNRKWSADRLQLSIDCMRGWLRGWNDACDDG